jgi:hypothetical protein
MTKVPEVRTQGTEEKIDCVISQGISGFSFTVLSFPFMDAVDS